MRLLRITLLCLFYALSTCNSYSFDGKHHVSDMYKVFGFIKPSETSGLYQWMKYISWNMIDKYNDIYLQIKRSCPGFSVPNHRVFFHWGYDAKPWNKELEEAANSYCSKREFGAIRTEYTITKIKIIIREEQKKRNRLLNQKTEHLFGFRHGGSDGKLANCFAGLAYDIHILGDYGTGNSELRGLQNFHDLVGNIVIILKKIDPEEFSKMRIKEGMNRVMSKYNNTQRKADMLMSYLQNNVPLFIKRARKGGIYRRLKNKGFQFKY